VAADPVLLQFAREPRPGAVKTRMLPHLSPEEACDLHRELVRWTCRQLLDSGLGEVHLWVAGDAQDPLFVECLDMGVAGVSVQRGADLGERMYRALAEGLGDGAAAILVGSDCPALSPAYLELARGGLSRADVVIGPAEDGGFVLVGARRLHRAMFDGVRWGSGEVLARTLDNLRDCGLAVELLPTLWDVDRPGDLAAWEALREVVF